MTIEIGNNRIKSVCYGSYGIKEIYHGNDLVWSSNVVLTINPTPNNAIVELCAQGYTQSGNSIIVSKGTMVSYTVSSENHQTQSGTLEVCEDMILNVALSPLYSSVTEYTINVSNSASFSYFTYTNTVLSPPLRTGQKIKIVVSKDLKGVFQIGQASIYLTTDWYSDHSTSQYIQNESYPDYPELIYRTGDTVDNFIVNGEYTYIGADAWEPGTIILKLYVFADESTTE